MDSGWKAFRKMRDEKRALENGNKSSKDLDSDRFSPDFLATLPKKVAAAIKDIPVSEAQEKLPDELKLYYEKLRQKRGADFEKDILQAFNPLRSRSADDFPKGSNSELRAREGNILGAILLQNPTFKATVPVACERSNYRAPELIGSGVLLRIGDCVFLFTAAHIADFAGEGTLLIPGRDGFMPVNGFYSVGPMPPSGNRDDDNLDVAFVCLNTECAENLDAGRIIFEASDLSLEAEPKLRYIYSFAGYPWRKSRARQSAIETEFITIESSEIPKEQYEALGLARSKHIAIQFNRKRTFSELHRRVVVPPMPSGMSGGGVYAWSEDALKKWPVRLPLVGIANEYIPDKSLLIATRLNFYFRCIANVHPHLVSVE